MQFVDHIEEIRSNLTENAYQNEIAVYQYIVTTLLQELEWPVDPKIVIPGNSVDGTIQVTLQPPDMQPQVLILAAQVGKADEDETQLFNRPYANAPAALVTDGRTWRFYVLNGGGPQESTAYALDLLDEPIDHAASRFRRYLHYRAVASGNALNALNEDLEAAQRNRAAKEAIPEAWSALVEDQEELLFEIISEKVKEICSREPSNEQIVGFLKSLRCDQTEIKQPAPPTKRPGSRPSPGTSARRPATRLKVTLQDGTVIERRNAVDTLVEVVMALGPEKVMSADEEGLIIRKTPFDRGSLRQIGDYYITTDYGTSRRKQLLDRIAKRLGVQLIVDITEKS